LHRVTSIAMKPSPFSVVAALLLGLAVPAAQAQDEPSTPVAPVAPVAPEVELDTISTQALDQAAYATLLPNPDVVDSTLVQSAITAALSAAPAKPKSIVPTGKTVKPAIKPVVIDPNAVAIPSTRLVFDQNQAVQIHADGAPAPNAPDPSPFVRVL